MNSVFSFAAHLVAADSFLILEFYFHHRIVLHNTHTQPFNGPWSGTTQVGRYQKKHSHPSWSSDILYQLPPFTTIHSSLRAWQSFSATSLQVLFGLPLGLGPSTSYSMHFFTQSSSSFRSTSPYQRSLFCCNTNAMSSTPSLSLSSLLGSLPFSLTPHIHLTILISARWSATTFSYLTGQVSLPCNMLHTTSEKILSTINPWIR